MNHLQRNRHGGHCCGINHVNNFTTGTPFVRYNFGTSPKSPGTSIEDLKQRIKESTGSVVEVVLTRHQLTYNDAYLEKLMKKARFRLVSTFKNTNSGSQCYVFHYYKAFRRRKNDLPLVLPSEEVATDTAAV